MIIRKRLLMIGIIMREVVFVRLFFPGSEWAYLDILNNKLGKTVLDDPRHTTCTGIGYHSDVVPIETIMTVVARHFALMTEAGFENMTPSCITSFGIYTEILHTWETHPEWEEKDPGIFMESNETGIPKAEEPGTYFRCHL